MDERPDEILEHIESERNRLGSNLSELETRVKSTTDWRAQFDKHPMLMMGVALGGGLLLGSMVGGSSRGSSSSSRYGRSGSASYLTSEPSYRSSSTASSRPVSPVVQQQKQRALETVDNIKAALIAFGLTKAREYLVEMVPGFQPHLDEAERKGGSSRTESSSQFSSASQPASESSYRYSESNQPTPAL